MQQHHIIKQLRYHRDRDRMVVEFTTTRELVYITTKVLSSN
jgi:hypothetical protein